MPHHFKPSRSGKPGRSPVPTRLPGHLRIIGGQWRSRVLTFPDAEGLRPTANRVRETLFNWLGQTLHGKRCLDLFSGSGALGFEAASRGAEEVVMLDNATEVVRALATNKQNLAASNCRILQLDSLKFLDTSHERFDVIFVDPPFGSDLLVAVLPKLAARLAEGGLVYAEWNSALPEMIETIAPGRWLIVKQGRAGAVHFALLQPHIVTPAL